MDRPAGTPGLPPEPLVAGRADPIAEHVRAALDLSTRALLDGEAGAGREKTAEPVHRMRISVRRMRVVLRSAAPFLDQRWSEPLRAELGWLGRELGVVRDLDVLLARLHRDAADFDAAQRESAGRLFDAASREHRAAREALLAVLAGQRYRALVDALTSAVREPLPASAVEQSGMRELRALVAEQYRRLRRAVDEVGPGATDEELHELRLLGKRLRWTAELAEPVSGKPMRQLLAAAKRFQDVLGELHDARNAEEQVRRLLADLGPDVRLAFVSGRLVEREHARRVDHREQWWERWRELRSSAAKV
ncbi:MULTISPECIES: CHAD domain-containing protein [unclassified Saccharopolyspora]|uniref:CHAD domain-containing protein n=1 Tax=unclassified Saccharopolyspora TaxID=2646250 RepID=UPI001CD32D09|nr:MULTISPECIES: CHAD domain-containing protein [unclassified Saccharopolyspora]MCA1185447.1 CHAD domain-containing protein [Saccharopolyspora sp. 6T]MCA1192330.1 CHAD domain-containing protein [Saccharopolyspora sp. 6V]MCA1225212.1 CHAD domain-containing protein [Saccharopolyspora sp. 6M]MCA1279549.1 CHAD domain-containing protein [Saccharopolyspora sp. 7B]